MEYSLFEIKYPNVFFLLAIVIAFALALWFYYKNTSWNKTLNRVLTLLRASALFLILLFLLEPIVRKVITQEEKPEVCLLVDNSSSMLFNTPKEKIIEAVNEVSKGYADLGFAVSLFKLDGEKIETLDSLNFEGEQSNIDHGLDELSTLFKGRNLKKTVLVSDGIFNRGKNPEYANYDLPLDVLMVGDTALQNDVVLQKLRYNRTARLENDFFIEANIENQGFVGEELEVSLWQKKKLVTKRIKLEKQTGLNKLRFKVKAEKEGVQRYTIKIKPLADEANVQNNELKAYVNVIKERKKILVLAAAPHPDIKTLNKLFDRRDQYETSIVYPFSQTKVDVNDFALVIAYQLPDKKATFDNLLQKIKTKKTPVLFVVGNRSDLTSLNNFQSAVKFPRNTNDIDQVHAQLNQKFSLFSLSDEELKLYQAAPPLIVPYLDYKASAGSQTLMFQAIGGVSTNKPLLSVYRNSAVFIGEGIWKWGIFQGMYHPRHLHFEELMFKVCQMLIQKNKNVKFDCIASQEHYSTLDNPSFFVQALNDLNEEVYNLPIKLKVYRNDSLHSEIDFVNYPGKSKYNTPLLPAGIYRYEASTVMAGKKHKARGQFSVEEIELEHLNTRANKEMLVALADKNRGKLYDFAQLDSMIKDQETVSNKPLLRSHEQDEDLLNTAWLALIILLFLSLEWGIRKRIGGTA